LVKNKRRVEVASGQTGVGISFIDIDFDKGQVVNLHGFRAEFITEPEDADANANGTWAVYVLPGGIIQNADLPATFGEFGDEDNAPYLWGIGVWASANQTPSHTLFAPKSTRNIQAGGRVVLEIFVNGVSGGLVRQRTILTGFTTAVS